MNVKRSFQRALEIMSVLKSLEMWVLHSLRSAANSSPLVEKVKPPSCHRQSRRSCQKHMLSESWWVTWIRVVQMFLWISVTCSQRSVLAGWVLQSSDTFSSVRHGLYTVRGSSGKTNLLLFQNKILLIFKAAGALSLGAKLTTNPCRHHKVMTHFY